MALQADFAQILTANQVPVSFSTWLASQGVLSIKNFANVAVSTDRFEHDVIDGCGLNLGLGHKAFVRSAWADTKAAHAIDPTSASNAASTPVADDAPLSSSQTQGLLIAWRDRHKFSLSGFFLVHLSLFNRIFRAMHKLPVSLAVPNLVNIKLAANLDQRQLSGTFIGPNGTMSHYAEVYDNVVSHIDLWRRVRALFYSICYVMLPTDPDFFPLEACVDFCEHLLEYMSRTYNGHSPGTQFFSGAYLGMMHDFTEEMHRHSVKLFTLTENRGRWQHHWTNDSSSGGAVGVADAPLALTNHAHQAESIATSVVVAPGTGNERRVRPRGRAKKGAGKGAKGAGRKGAAAAAGSAAADQGSAWNNWSSAWGNRKGAGKGARKGAGRGRGGGKGGRT